VQEVTFTLTHNAQNKPLPEPVPLKVTPAPRSDYKNPCHCKTVFVVAPDSVSLLIKKRLVLESQRTDKQVICACLGVLDSEPKHEDFAAELQTHLETWGPNCGAPRDVYEGHLMVLLAAHGEAMGKRAEPRLPRLTRPLAVVDLETTDAEPTTCAIFQFAVTIINPDGSRKYWSQLFKPWKPISPGAEEVTGISNAMVENYPPFSQFAEKIAAGLKGKDLAGYNIKGFDAIVLDEELRRTGSKLDLEGVIILDVFHIFQRKDPRDLTAAVRKYCGRDHEGAHGAPADCEATADVMQAMLGEYDDLSAMSLQELDTFSLRDPDKKLADLAGKFYFDSDGDLRYTMAKVRDVKVREDSGFAFWMLKQTSPPFAGNTTDVLRAELKRIGAL
jgi:DNA polymerase-3 subunit epsilon